MSTYFWPPSGDTVATVASNALDSSGQYQFLLADWRRPAAYTFTPGSGYSNIVQTTGIAADTGSWGIASLGVFNGYYLQTFTDGIYSVGGLFTPSTASGVYEGTVITSPTISGTVASILNQANLTDNYVYAVSGSAPYKIGPFTNTPKSITGSGQYVIALVPASGTLEVMDYTGAITGIALPSGIVFPSCLTVSGGVAIGGTANAPLLPGATAILTDPVDPQAVVSFIVSSGFVYEPTLASGYNWTPVAVATGFTSNIANVAGLPNGVQIFASDVVSGIVQIINNTAGILTVAQNISLPDVTALAALSTNSNVLAAIPATNYVYGLTGSASSWAITTATSGFNAPSTLVTYGPTQVAVGYTSGIGTMSLVGGSTWVIENQTPLTFIPSALAADEWGNVFVAASGQLAVYNGSGIVATGVIPGNVSALLATSGRVYAADPAGVIRILGQESPTTWSVMGSAATIVNVSGFALAFNSLFATSVNGTYVYSFGAPYELNRTQQGGVAVSGASGWVATYLDNDNYPCAVSFDASGNLLVATTINNLYTVVSGAVTVSGIVPSYQSQSVPLGVSNLLITSGGNYATTSLPGVLIEI